MSEPRVQLLKALAHTLRLRVVGRLEHLGPASVSALAAELDAPLPELSNHLKRLRDAGLVTAHRKGRHAVYLYRVPRGIDTAAGESAPSARPTR